MSERKTMKTFFAAMNEQIGMGGYASKIKSTPMGPFRWNDLMQLWENVNNGMVMNNISFQDMMAMDYGTESGDTGTPPNNPSLVPADWGNLTGMDTAATDYWASSTGPQLSSTNATAVQFTSLRSPITVTLTNVNSIGSSPTAIKYILNTGSVTTYSTPIAITNGDTLKIAVTTPGGVGVSGVGVIRVTNVATSTILDNIDYSLAIE